jgi:hypothetical protein
MTELYCGDNSPDCGHTSCYRSTDIQEMFGIKQRTYYDRLKFLGIESHKDEDGKPYLDEQQLDLLTKLDEYIRRTGKMEGFDPTNNGASLVKAGADELETASSQKIGPQGNPVPENEDQINEFDYSAQSRAAEVLKTAGDALTAEYIANPHKLAPELREKVFARSNGLPKLYDPAEVVKGIVAAAQGRYKGRDAS